MSRLYLVLASLFILAGCGDNKQRGNMIVTPIHNKIITVLNTNATDTHEVAQYNKFNGFWYSLQDYTDKELLQYNDAIYEINIPHGYVEWKPFTYYPKDTVVKYVSPTDNRVYYLKAIRDVPKGYDYTHPIGDELNTQCIMGARPADGSDRNWRYQRRIENFTDGSSWYCSGVGASHSYQYRVYLDSGDWHLETTDKGTVSDPDDTVISDIVVQVGKIEDRNTPYFTFNGDFYERNIYYDGSSIEIQVLDLEYWATIDILDAFYYCPLNQNKILDEDLNSKTTRDDNLTFKFEVNASKFYLYGVVGEHLKIKVDDVVKMDKDIEYSEHGFTEWIKLSDANAMHTVEVEITASGLECALGDVYVNNRKSINLGITDYNVDFKTIDTRKLVRKAGGVIDFKEGIKFISASVTVHNYSNIRHTLLRTLTELTAKRYAFDLEDSEPKAEIDGQEIFIIGFINTSGFKLQNKNNELSELTPLTFTIEEYA